MVPFSARFGDRLGILSLGCCSVTVTGVLCGLSGTELQLQGHSPSVLRTYSMTGMVVEYQGKMLTVAHFLAISRMRCILETCRCLMAATCSVLRACTAFVLGQGGDVGEGASVCSKEGSFSRIADDGAARFKWGLVEVEWCPAEFQ